MKIVLKFVHIWSVDLFWGRVKVQVQIWDFFGKYSKQMFSKDSGYLLWEIRFCVN